MYYNKNNYGYKSKFSMPSFLNFDKEYLWHFSILNIFSSGINKTFCIGNCYSLWIHEFHALNMYWMFI